MRAVTTVVIAAFMLTLGCSSGANDVVVGAGDAGPLDASVADAHSRDAALDAADGAACAPEAPPVFQPPAYRPATGAHQGACSSSQIAAVFQNSRRVTPAA